MNTETPALPVTTDAQRARFAAMISDARHFCYTFPREYQINLWQAREAIDAHGTIGLELRLHAQPHDYVERVLIPDRMPRFAALAAIATAVARLEIITIANT